MSGELCHPDQADVDVGVGPHVCPDCNRRACLCYGRNCPHCGYNGGYQQPLDEWGEEEQ